MKKLIEESFHSQGFLKTLGAELIEVQEGSVTIACAYKEGLTQQNGFFHAGVLASLMDAACGYAALTMMPEGSNVLSVEFKTNLMRPATSKKIIATGQVIKPGRTLYFCEGTIIDAVSKKLLASMSATMICRKDD